MATTVKICGVRDVATAIQAFRYGADYVGLVVTPSPRRLDLNEAARLIAAVPRGRFIAVGKDVSPDLLSRLLDLPVVGIQLHGHAPDQWIATVHQAEKLAIATEDEPQADVRLLDGAVPGSGIARDWHMPPSVRPVWLAGGLSPTNVRHVVRTLGPDGVDVSSGVEQDGVKSLTKIRQFIEEVKYADRERA